jgi:hypothetical protein
LHDRFSEVIPEWQGKTAVLIGAGASLTAMQVAQVHAAHVGGNVMAVAINDCYLWCDWADVHYAADAKWHKWHTEGLDKPLLRMTAAQVREAWATFAGQKCSIQDSMDGIADDTVHILRNKSYPNHAHGLSRDPQALGTGWHSGFQALNLAILAGAKTIILLGFDGKPSQEGRTHFFGEHPSPTNPAVFEQIRRSFSAAENEIKDLGVRVINCSPGSAIDSFEKMELGEALRSRRKT